MPKVICDLYDFLCFWKSKMNLILTKYELIWFLIWKKYSITIQILIYSKMCVCVGGVLWAKNRNYCILNVAIS